LVRLENKDVGRPCFLWVFLISTGGHLKLQKAFSFEAGKPFDVLVGEQMMIH